MRKMLPVVVCTILVGYFCLWAFVSTEPNRIADPGHRYTILGNNFFYPSMILQGKDGAWGIIDTHTTRPVRPIYVHTYFILLGKIAALLGIDAVTMYLVARIFSGIFLFIAVWRIITLLVPPAYRLFVLIFTLGVETGPLLTSLWQPSFTNQVTYERFFGLPHHVTGEALGLWLLAELYLTIRRPTTLRSFTLAVLTAMTAIVLPPYPAVIGLTALAVWFMWSAARGKFAKIFPPFFLVGAVYLGIAVFMNMEFAKGLPWTVSAAAEKSWWDTPTLLTQYTSSLFLYIPFIILLWIVAFGRWKKLDTHIQWLILTMSAWVVFPYFLIPLAKTSWFPIANFRLVDGTQYVPAGILAGLGLGMSLLHRAKMILLLLCVISLSLTTIYTRQTLDRQKTPWSNMYPLAATWEAVTSLHTYVEKGSGVMVREYFGEILPAFADIRVFIGGPHGWPDWPERQAITMQFFSGTMSDTDALALLHREDISYVFMGPDEQTINVTGTLYPTILTPVFTTGSVSVYRVL